MKIDMTIEEIAKEYVDSQNFFQRDSLSDVFYPLEHAILLEYTRRECIGESGYLWIEDAPWVKVTFTNIDKAKYGATNGYTIIVRSDSPTQQDISMELDAEELFALARHKIVGYASNHIALV